MRAQLDAAEAEAKILGQDVLLMVEFLLKNESVFWAMEPSLGLCCSQGLKWCRSTLVGMLSQIT